MALWRKGLVVGVAVAAGIALVGSPAGAAPKKRPALPGDVNGDGRADVIAGAPLLKAGGKTDAGAVVVWFGGTKVSAKARIAISSKPVAKENLGQVVATADFDRDGHADVLASARKRIVVFRGSATGLRFSKSFAWPVTNAPMQAADFNGDGYGDAVVQGNKEIVVFKGGNKGLTKSATLKNGAAKFGAVLAVGDVTGDRRPDLVATNFRPAYPEPTGPQRVTVIPGNAKGLAMARAWSFEPARRDIVDVVAGDLTGDGKADLALATGEGGVLVQKSSGSGFGTPQTLAFDYYPANLAAGDVTGDGRADLVVHVSADNHDWAELYSGTATGVTKKASRKYDRENYETLFGRAMWMANVAGDAKVDFIAGMPGVYGIGEIHVLPKGSYTGLQRLKLGSRASDGVGSSLP